MVLQDSRGEEEHSGRGNFSPDRLSARDGPCGYACVRVALAEQILHLFGLNRLQEIGHESRHESMPIGLSHRSQSDIKLQRQSPSPRGGSTDLLRLCWRPGQRVEVAALGIPTHSSGSISACSSERLSCDLQRLLSSPEFLLSIGVFDRQSLTSTGVAERRLPSNRRSSAVRASLSWSLLRERSAKRLSIAEDESKLSMNSEC